MINTGRRSLVVVNTSSPTKEEKKPKVEPSPPGRTTTLPTTAPLTDSDEQSIELQWPRPRGWAMVALSKLADTAEDIAVIGRRTLNNAGWV